MDRTHHLRVLIANQRKERLELLAQVVLGLGHKVIAREIKVQNVGAVTARERPDVALVGLGESSEHALQLITEIVRGAFCPVIALLEAYDAGWIDQAAERGVYAYIVDTRPEELQSAIDIALRRYAEIEDTQAAFDRHAAESLAERRQAHQIQDEVVQGLVVVQLDLDRNRSAEPRESLVEALENARRAVSRSIDGLSEGPDRADERTVESRRTAP